MLSSVTGAAAEPDSPEAPGLSLSGHLKYQFLLQALPRNSLFREFTQTPALDQALEARLKFARDDGAWDFRADYQFFAVHADTLLLGAASPGRPSDAVVSDDRRWWDLTYRFGDDRTAIVHRLDRLNIGYTTERSAWRFGRQAISWGNGMLFTPMDVFNPFDPAAVDKEYKPGDDMLYGQWLFANGSDLQGVAVVRRDPVNGDVERDQSSLALKYHALAGMAEIDLLGAEHYGEALLGLGGTAPLGGAIWRADLTWNRSERGGVVSAVTSLGYSWTWGGRNLSGVLEYYRNGFGQSGGRYSAADLADNPVLLARLARGELFTLGRHYLAASATLEWSPLVWLTPALFVNLGDPSALAQLVAQVDLRQELVLRAALNLPLGPDGSEYGGIESPLEERYLSTGPGLFAQLAWYF